MDNTLEITNDAEVPTSHRNRLVTLAGQYNQLEDIKSQLSVVPEFQKSLESNWDVIKAGVIDRMNGIEVSCGFDENSELIDRVFMALASFQDSPEPNTLGGKLLYEIDGTLQVLKALKSSTDWVPKEVKTGVLTSLAKAGMITAASNLARTTIVPTVVANYNLDENLLVAGIGAYCLITLSNSLHESRLLKELKDPSELYCGQVGALAHFVNGSVASAVARAIEISPIVLANIALVKAADNTPPEVISTGVSMLFLSSILGLINLTYDELGDSNRKKIRNIVQLAGNSIRNQVNTNATFYTEHVKVLFERVQSFVSAQRNIES